MVDCPKSKGKLFIAVPNYGSLWSRLTGENWPWLNPKEHYYHYTQEALKRIFKQQGFKILSLKTYSSLYCLSILNVFLSERHIYERGFFSMQPFKWMTFKFADGLRRPLNFLVDLLSKGAEIHTLAENY